MSLLVDQSSRWVAGVNALASNMASGKMYRPSGFFLEPSHLYLYSVPCLAVCLLHPGMNGWMKRRAIVITLGIILSTSGMGIAAVVGLWGVYILSRKHDGNITLKSILSGRTVLMVLVLLVAVVAMYFTVPVFQNSINRIFFNASGSTAIAGRVQLASNYVKSISGKAILFGVDHSVSELDFNLSGFFATYIKSGLIGLVLTYWFYGQGFVKFRGAYYWLTLILVVTSFFSAHTHGTFYLMYYVIFLMNGYYEKEMKKG